MVLLSKDVRKDFDEFWELCDDLMEYVESQGERDTIPLPNAMMCTAYAAQLWFRRGRWAEETVGAMDDMYSKMLVSTAQMLNEVYSTVGAMPKKENGTGAVAGAPHALAGAPRVVAGEGQGAKDKGVENE